MELPCFTDAKPLLWSKSHSLGAGHPSADPLPARLSPRRHCRGPSRGGAALGSRKSADQRPGVPGSQSRRANSSDNGDGFYYPREDALSRRDPGPGGSSAVRTRLLPAPFHPPRCTQLTPLPAPEWLRQPRPSHRARTGQPGRGSHVFPAVPSSGEQERFPSHPVAESPHASLARAGSRGSLA